MIGPSKNVMTVSTTLTPVMRFDPSYFSSPGGALKIAHMVSNLLAYICFEVAPIWTGSKLWFRLITINGLSLTSVLLWLYVFHVVERYTTVPWLKMELGYCTIMTCCYVIAWPLIVVCTPYSNAHGVTAFFGCCAMILYGCDAWLRLVQIIRGVRAQGERTWNQKPVTLSAV